MPEKSYQDEIVSILGTIDKKIEFNNKVNLELEKMAKTLYDYWFVQFDFPNKDGKTYKTSGGEMEYKGELRRDIPHGWKVEYMENTCLIIDCLHSKKPNRILKGEKYLLQLMNIVDGGMIDLDDKYFVIDRDYKKWTSNIEVFQGDIVITNAGRVGAFAQIPQGTRAGIGRNITAIRPHNVCPTYLYYAFGGIDIQMQINTNTDAGAFFNSLNVRGIKNLKIVIPPINLMENFENKARPLRRKMEDNYYENQQLSQLKDFLLPLLINGQVRAR